MGGFGSGNAGYAGRKKEPIDLLLAKGRSQFSKETIEQRRNSELKVPFKDVVSPDYLSENQKKEFNEIAEKLLALGIMTELDVDCLARYVMSQSLYLSYTAQLAKAIKKGDADAMGKIQNQQDKAFRQAVTCARDLGMTITARCRIVVPPPPDEDDEL